LLRGHPAGPSHPTDASSRCSFARRNSPDTRAASGLAQRSFRAGPHRIRQRPSIIEAVIKIHVDAANLEPDDRAERRSVGGEPAASGERRIRNTQSSPARPPRSAQELRMRETPHRAMRSAALRRGKLPQLQTWSPRKARTASSMDL